MKAKSLAADALPVKATLDELKSLRADFRELMGHYTAAIEGQLAQLVIGITAVTAAKKIPAERLNDLRDVIMFIRDLKIKPAKGRRRDLKKIESVIEELRRIAERW